MGLRLLGAGLLLAMITGCVVREGPPPPRYYYRTRLVYTASGPMYVRERVYYGPYYEPDPTYAPPGAVVTGPPPGSLVTTPGAMPRPGSDVSPIESAAATQLRPLVAPIALYPDPLIAVVLPASTYPQQVQDANAFLAANPQPPQGLIDAQPWAPSVKALVHYPTVLAQLSRDMSWTQSLGAAYINQPTDVMNAIQQMRAQAMAQGNLVTTPQQVVVQDGGTIAIEPANPEVIYVPQYDSVVVYEAYHPIYYSEVAYATGPWLTYGVYWGGGVIFVGDWHGGYYYRDGHWGRDYAWRVDSGHYWARDARFGPAPFVDRGHYAAAAGVRGREMELHRSMAQSAPQRHEVEQHGMGRDRR
jgi:hypothetical protein